MRLFVLTLLALVGCRGHVRPKLPLVTVGEQSGYTRTGRYDETVQLCRDFSRVYEGVRCEVAGTTLEDRPIVALHVSRGGKKPTIYLQGGIHAGEIDGKDAGFWFLRDLLDGKVAAGALDKIDVVFVPVINPDGHERFGPNNRPNQRGPEEMGFRTNASRVNLNRDYVKADSLEIQAVLGLYRKYEPIVAVDMHVTDGAKFEHDVAVLVGTFAARADGLDELSKTMSDQLDARLTALGHLPLPFYPSFDKDDDPASGFSVGEAPLRFSQSYASARSKIGILVETHSWRPYKHRVETTYHVLQALFEQAAKDAPAWARIEAEAAEADRRLLGGELPVDYDNGPHVVEFPFRGYAYEKKPSDISGGTWITYDETKPQIWNVPLHDEVVAKTSVRVPKVGYVIEGGFAAQLAPVLDHHGIEYKRIDDQPQVDVEVYRATKVTFAQPFEGRTRATFEGAWTSEKRTLDRGAFFVSLAQPNVRLIVHLFDPEGPDSFAQWGFLQAAFERKEYMEAYVAEEAAREMLAKDPSLRAKFEAALAADPEMAKSPERRLEFFYKRHPAWDERVNLLPIYRVDVPLTEK
jgi:hypothetical protein